MVEDESVAGAIEAAKEGDEVAEEIAAAVLDERKDEAWLINEEQMKVFVNSERWSLGTSPPGQLSCLTIMVDSGSSNDPVLRFILFIPSSSHTPMQLEVAGMFPLPPR